PEKTRTFSLPESEKSSPARTGTPHEAHGYLRLPKLFAIADSKAGACPYDETSRAQGLLLDLHALDCEALGSMRSNGSLSIGRPCRAAASLIGRAISAPPPVAEALLESRQAAARAATAGKSISVWATLLM
ncbi:MAG: hypothetical protein E6417_20915, partial [Bradyrhizobium sp.]|nr:hypothetical protein [Bradyrhizobium sp.]